MLKWALIFAVIAVIAGVLGFGGIAGAAAGIAALLVGHQFQVVAGLLREVNQVFIDDAAYTVAGAVDQINTVMAPCFQHHADEALVDHGGGAAALGDQYFSGCQAGVLRS